MLCTIFIINYKKINTKNYIIFEASNRYITVKQKIELLNYKILTTKKKTKPKFKD